MQPAGSSSDETSATTFTRWIATEKLVYGRKFIALSRAVSATYNRTKNMMNPTHPFVRNSLASFDDFLTNICPRQKNNSNHQTNSILQPGNFNPGMFAEHISKVTIVRLEITERLSSSIQPNFIYKNYGQLATFWIPSRPTRISGNVYSTDMLEINNDAKCDLQRYLRTVACFLSMFPQQ